MQNFTLDLKEFMKDNCTDERFFNKMNWYLFVLYFKLPLFMCLSLIVCIHLIAWKDARFFYSFSVLAITIINWIGLKRYQYGGLLATYAMLFFNTVISLNSLDWKWILFSCSCNILEFIYFYKRRALFAFK